MAVSQDVWGEVCQNLISYDDQTTSHLGLRLFSTLNLNKVQMSSGVVRMIFPIITIKMRTGNLNHLTRLSLKVADLGKCLWSRRKWEL